MPMTSGLPPSSKRPLGVAIIAIFYFILSGLGLVFFVLSLRFGAPPDLISKVGSAWIFFLISSFFYLVVAVGLFTLRNWARRLLMIICIWSLCQGIYHIFKGDFSSSTIFSIGINILILWYLNRGAIKHFFEDNRGDASRTARQ